jgi:hypothetical protein
MLLMSSFWVVDANGGEV